ncbi:hypothetical protein KAU19_08490 [Candidatus Parcubacteria bacterium]|nr:hypothetical protein [Candidatus Parcubacteria bacterium]
MKAISRKNISFPSLGFKMKKGKEIELPEDKGTQEAILASIYVTKAEKDKIGKKAEDK